MTLDDVLVTLQRSEMTMRMADEIERNVAELGVEGRLIKIQLDDMTEWVPGDRIALVRDYDVPEVSGGWRAVLAALDAMPDEGLLELEELAQVLGYPRAVNPMDHAVSPRGFRVLSKVPRLPEAVVEHVITHFSGPGGVPAGDRRRAGGGRGRRRGAGKEIREGLRRLQEQNLVDRYLNL